MILENSSLCLREMGHFSCFLRAKHLKRGDFEYKLNKQKTKHILTTCIEVFICMSFYLDAWVSTFFTLQYIKHNSWSLLFICWYSQSLYIFLYTDILTILELCWEILFFVNVSGFLLPSPHLLPTLLSYSYSYFYSIIWVS